MTYPSVARNPKVAIALVLALLLVVSLTVAVSAPSAPQGRGIAEAPMQVATEGPTAQESLQRQEQLSRRLAGELPQAALDSAMHVKLSPEEIASVDRAPRSAPLKIGIVKPLFPGIEVFGLSRGASNGQPSQGASSIVRPTVDGGFVWALVVKSDEAGAIRLHVENLSLPRGAEMFLYSRDGQAHGPYAGDGPHGTGEFWTPTIFGSEAILQLRVSGPAGEADLRGVSFRVQEVGVITQNFVRGLMPVVEAPPPPGWPCGNPNCVVDASCYAGIANTLKLAVAKMEWIQGAFIYTCTGGLISDNNPAQGNFFLTANHCVSKNNNAQTVNFYWRFATSSCNGSSCPSNSGWPYQTSGSSVSKTGRKGDFTLLQLSTNPPSGSVFLGWTTANVANSNGTDLFRVSNPNFGPQVYSEHDVDTSAPTCSGWPRGERIYSRDTLGAIDGGSSGSPITNASAQIVGQLSGSCGTNPSNPCSSGPGEANATVDGAFAFYFSVVQPVLNP